MLGDPSPPSWTVINPSKGCSFKLINSTFYGSDGVALQYSGDGVKLVNNLFEYNDWYVANMRTKTGGLGTVIAKGENHKFVRNTMRFNGASNGFRPSGGNPLVKLNHNRQRRQEEENTWRQEKNSIWRQEKKTRREVSSGGKRREI